MYISKKRNKQIYKKVSACLSLLENASMVLEGILDFVEEEALPSGEDTEPAGLEGSEEEEDHLGEESEKDSKAPDKKYMKLNGNSEGTNATSSNPPSHLVQPQVGTLSVTSSPMDYGESMKTVTMTSTSQPKMLGQEPLVINTTSAGTSSQRKKSGSKSHVLMMRKKPSDLAFTLQDMQMKGAPSIRASTSQKTNDLSKSVQLAPETPKKM